jgi:two-component system response regulator HydG
MSPALQAKLLHVVETGTVRAVGDTRERSVDVRIIAATHRDLRARIQSGEFREDLLYRLEVVTIDLPPLRLRRDDLPILVEHFLQRAREKHSSSPVEQFSPEVYAAFLAHSWPGNVRELEHVVERLVVLGRGKMVSVDELPAPVRQHESDAFTFNGPVLPMREVQRRYAVCALSTTTSGRFSTALCFSDLFSCAMARRASSVFAKTADNVVVVSVRVETSSVDVHRHPDCDVAAADRVA